MKERQTVDKKIKEYACNNAKEMIDRIIELLAYQENVIISYTCRKREN